VAPGTLAGTEKKAQIERRELVLIDEAGFYLMPGRVRTYAPRGHTPVLRVWQSRDHLSMMSGVTPSGALYTMIREQPLTGRHSVEFLKHLLRCLGDRLLVIWDGSPIHRSHEVKHFLAQGDAPCVHLEPLPAYAPDLNPDEGVWNHLKYVEMRNVCCADLSHLHRELHLAIMRLRSKPHLIRSFFTEAGLEI
jgi:transposase